VSSTSSLQLVMTKSARRVAKEDNSERHCNFRNSKTSIIIANVIVVLLPYIVSSLLQPLMKSTPSKHRTKPAFVRVCLTLPTA
jgi:hypothetical protein